MRPEVLSQAYLEGTYSEVYPDKSEDLAGPCSGFFKQFSLPGGIGSHCTPEPPGSIHEGGELGYSISHANGAVYDHPNLIAVTVVGYGEAETGPIATSWHRNKLLNPIRDGQALCFRSLHLNGYKINNPTLLARISREELEALFVGYGYTPLFVEGSDPDSMHQAMAATLEQAVLQIRKIQQEARQSGKAQRSRWPMIILRSPKGWTAPRQVDGHYLEGFWRTHQIPIPDVHSDPAHLQILEKWLRSYEPEKHFDEDGRLIAALRDLPPKGSRRMSANPVANGGVLRKPLDMPDFRTLGIEVKKPGTTQASNASFLGLLMREIMRRNKDNFRLFGPDESQSNKLDAVYEITQKAWLGEYFPEDADGGNLALDGRVMEMLSEHTLEGWLEGYILSGRHGLINSYESFVHLIDSMFNQHAKWLEKCNELPWRDGRSPRSTSLSPAWSGRQDHNGFTHQDPGFLDVVVNKSPSVVHLLAARRQLHALGRRPLFPQPQLHQRHRRGQAAAGHAVPGHGGRDRPLHQGPGHLELGQQRPGR